MSSKRCKYFRPAPIGYLLAHAPQRTVAGANGGSPPLSMIPPATLVYGPVPCLSFLADPILQLNVTCFLSRHVAAEPPRTHVIIPLGTVCVSGRLDARSERLEKVSDFFLELCIVYHEQKVSPREQYMLNPFRTAAPFRREPVKL